MPESPEHAWVNSFGIWYYIHSTSPGAPGPTPPGSYSAAASVCGTCSLIALLISGALAPSTFATTALFCEQGKANRHGAKGQHELSDVGAKHILAANRRAGLRCMNKQENARANATHARTQRTRERNARAAHAPCT